LVVVQFAQKHCPSHSEASSIGEESLAASSETADSSRHQPALRNDNPWGILQTAPLPRILPAHPREFRMRV
jgi:hypothetical protein